VRASRGRAVRVVHSPLSLERRPEGSAETERRRAREPGWEKKEIESEVERAGRTQRRWTDPVENGE
jgi:hypothetical protein